MRKVILVGAAASLLAACASVPQRSEQVEQARSEIDTLAQQPLAQQAAGRDLDAARASLQQAETAEQQKAPPEIVDHLAYLALRHAQAGEARVAEARARQEVASGQQDRDRILLEARTRDARNAQLQAQNAQAQAQNAQAQAQSAQAQAENERVQAEAAKEQALAAQQQLADTQKQLADLQAKKTERGMVLTLGDVLFDTGQATLKPGADLVLGRLAKFLADNPQTKIMIEGHTDSRGSDDYNQALSERRAQSVADALTARGVSPDNVRTLGRGKAYPVATNDTPAGRQQNRRVEIIFSDPTGQFVQGAT